MHRYSLTLVPDHALLRDLESGTTSDSSHLADRLAQLGEVEARKLYLPAAYPSMSAYCVGQLRMSEDAAAKRLQAARAARRSPALFVAVAEGRIHLTGVVLLAPHLTPENETELLAAATHKSKAEIQLLLAERFPRPDVPAKLEAIPSSAAHTANVLPVLEPVKDCPAGQRDQAQSHPRVTPLSSRTFALQCTLSERAYEKLRYLQTLLGHAVPTGDLAAVIESCFDARIASLEKRKFAATTRPRSCCGSAKPGTRHVPAHVRRAVWVRDGGQCTFMSECGRRCEARSRLEFDHVTEFALGGEATVAGIRLRCRGHNQYQAEQTFGADFMRHKRETARAAMKARAVARPDPGPMPTEDDDKDVIPWLRALGYSVAEARRRAERCEHLPDASLEDRVRVALGGRRARAPVGT